MAELRVWFVCLFLKAALQGTLGNRIIVDVDPPVVTCSNVTLSTIFPNSFLGLQEGDYTYSDNHPDPSGVTFNVTSGLAGDIFPPGYTPITMFAEDIFGNQATCLFYVQNTLKELPVTCPDLNRNVSVDPGKTTFTFNPDFGADDVVKSVTQYRYHGAARVDLSIDGLPVGSNVTAGRHEVVAIISDNVLSKTCTGFYNVEEVEVSCSITEMTIKIPTSALQDGIDPLSLHLNGDSDGDCRSSRDNGGNIVFSTPYDKCGTTLESSGDSIIFSNAVTDSEGDNAPNLHLPVQCVFRTDQVVDGTPVDVTSEKLYSIKGFASYGLTLKRYNDEAFTTLASAESVGLRQELFYAVSPDQHLSSNLSMIIDSCWATPEPDPNATLRYHLIKNRCKHDSTLRIFSDLGHLKQGFSFEAFTFLGDYRRINIYLHCSVTMCVASNLQSRCQQGCIPDRARRSNRSLSNLIVYHVSSDRISVHEI